MTAFPALTGVGAARLAAGDERIVVVGAGGWLGLATLEALHQTLGDGFFDRVVCYGSSRRSLRLRGFEVVQAPLSELASLSSRPSLVLHYAFLTQEKAKAMRETDYVAANRAISGQVLAALDPIGATGVFVASSGAVYMADDPGAEESKRLYGRLKLEDEADFARWSRQADGRRAAIARIFNVSGPYITLDGGYALAAFIVDALAGRPISIRARRPVYRSYVAINELLSVVFGLLTDETSSSTVFDTAGSGTGEMGDIASAVAAALSRGVGIERALIEAGDEDRYVGDGVLYQALRHRFDVPTVDFAAQIRQTSTYVAGLGVEFP